MRCSNVFLAVLFLAAAGLAQAAVGNESAPRRIGRALLVGASRYAVLGEQMRAKGKGAEFEKRVELKGPENDVQAMRQVCIDVLGIRAEDIELLADRVARGGVEVAGPASRANIEAGFRRLEGAAAGELVVILLAGHGSRVPDRNGDEPDGHDEVFLPTDVATYEPATQACPNVICDDEIATWISAILAKGARVWLIVDACHSATMARDGFVNEDRSRFLEPALLGVPAETDPRPKAQVVVEQVCDPLRFGDAFVGFYAVGVDERAPERRWAGCDREFGILTWQVVRQLTRCGAGISFGELQRMIGVGYAATGTYSCLRPSSEGAIDQRIVDGAPVGWRMNLALEGRTMVLDSGQIQGLHRGDVVDVFAAGRRADPAALLGRVRVKDAQAMAAVCEPDKDRPLDPRQLKGGVSLPAELAMAAAESRRLRFSCLDGTADPQGVPLGADRLPPCLRAEALQAVGLSSRVVFAEPTEAECTIRLCAGDRVVVQDATHRLTGPAERAADLLGRLVHARRVLSIPDLVGTMAVGGAVACEVEVGSDQVGWRTLVAGTAVHPGELARLRYRSTGSQDCSLWWFCIDADLDVGPCKHVVVRKQDDKWQTTCSLPFHDRVAGTECMMLLVAPPATDLGFLAMRERQALRGNDPIAQLMLDLLGDAAETRSPPLNGSNVGATMIGYHMRPHQPIELDPDALGEGMEFATEAPPGDDVEAGLWSHRGHLSIGRSDAAELTWVQIVERGEDGRVIRLRRYYDLDDDASLSDPDAVVKAFASGEGQRYDFELMVEFVPGKGGRLVPLRTASDVDDLNGFDRVHGDFDTQGFAHSILVRDGGRWSAAHGPRPWLVLGEIHAGNKRTASSRLALLHAALGVAR